MTPYDQSEYDVRCEWGLDGLHALLPECDVVIVVDVLSFSTAVDIAVSRGAIIYPYFGETPAAALAEEIGGLVAGDNPYGYSLRPSTLTDILPGTRLVLPSLNGAALSLQTESLPTFAGCLRNAAAVAQAAREIGKRIGVVPAGERWEWVKLRPALEDLLGAGAIIAELPGSRSPEAESAQIVFEHYRATLLDAISRCSSGKELLERDRPQDIELACQLNISQSTPQIIAGAYTTAV